MAVGIPALVALWWAFRPEKLWIDEKVNEPAPFASSADSQPIFTGLLEGRAHPTRGRATIYNNPDGKHYLRLTDFTTSNGPDVHVVLARSGDQSLRHDIVKGDLDSLEVAPLKGNQGDQNCDLPAGADLNKYQTVVIYCERFHPVFGVAMLDRF